MGESDRKESAKRTGQSLIWLSYACLSYPVLNTALGAMLLVLVSLSLHYPGVQVYVVVYPVWFLTFVATCASPFVSCLGVFLALRGLLVSQTRREVLWRASVAVVLNMLGILASVFWLFGGRGLLLFLRGYSYLMAKDGRAMSRMITNDVSKISMESFFQSIGTLRQTDLRPDLHKIKVPTMGMYGQRDIIVRPTENKILQLGVPHAQIEWFPDAGHFIMMDSPERFITTLRGWLHAK